MNALCPPLTDCTVARDSVDNDSNSSKDLRLTVTSVKRMCLSDGVRCLGSERCCYECTGGRNSTEHSADTTIGVVLVVKSTRIEGLSWMGFGFGSAVVVFYLVRVVLRQRVEEIDRRIGARIKDDLDHGDEVGRDREHRHYTLCAIGLVGSLYVILVLVTSGLTFVYTMQTLVGYDEGICEPITFFYSTWCGIALLLLLDHIVTSTGQYDTRNNCLNKLCVSCAFGWISHVGSGILTLWWLFLIVYLYGAHRHFWDLIA